jgi:hypothetical protein
VDYAADCDAPTDDWDAVAFFAHNERQRAPAALAHDDDDSALGRLFFGKTAVNAILSFVPRPRLGGEMCAVNLDGPG